MNRAYSTLMPSTHEPSFLFSALEKPHQENDHTVDLIMVNQAKNANTVVDSILLKGLLRGSLVAPPTLLIPKAFGVVSQVCYTQPQRPAVNASLPIHLTPELTELPSDGAEHPQPQPSEEPAKQEQPSVLQSHAPLPPTQVTTANKKGLQFTKHDIKYGFTQAEDSLLFGGARQPLSHKETDNSVMVLNYLKWQVANFSVPKPTSSTYPITTRLQPSEAGTHNVQKTTILTLKDLRVDDQPAAVENLPATTQPLTQPLTHTLKDKLASQQESVQPSPQSMTGETTLLSIPELKTKLRHLAMMVDRLNKQMTHFPKNHVTVESQSHNAETECIGESRYSL